MKSAIAVALAGLIVGWALCSLFNRPSESWESWKQSADSWRDSVKVLNDSTTARERRRDSVLAIRDNAIDQMRKQFDLAQQAGFGRLFHKGRADSLQAVLDSIQHPDSAAKVCKETLSARSAEAKSCAQQVVQLERSVQSGQSAVRAANEALEIERNAHGATKRALGQGVTVVKESPSPSGCGTPLCAAISPIYQLDDREILLAITIPFGKKWFRPGVGRSVFR